MSSRSLRNPKVSVQVQANVRNTMDDGTVVSGAMNGLVNDTLTDGVSAGQANRGWQWKERTLLEGNDGVLDLSDFSDFLLFPGKIACQDEICARNVSPVRVSKALCETDRVLQNWASGIQAG